MFTERLLSLTGTKEEARDSQNSPRLLSSVRGEETKIHKNVSSSKQGQVDNKWNSHQHEDEPRFPPVPDVTFLAEA